MALPSSAVTRLDLSLTFSEFSLAANRRGFIGLRALPAVGVAQDSAKFLKIPVEQLLKPVEDLKRSDKAGYKRDDFEFTEDSYATDDYGAEEVLGDRSLKRYSSLIRAERIHAMRAIYRVQQAYEQACANAVFDTATWTGEALTTNVDIPWTTAASAKPIEDIDGAIDQVTANIGRRPNGIIIPYKAAKAMMRTAQITDLVKYSGHTDPTQLVASAVAILQSLFDFEIILIPDGVKNTGKEGGSAAFTRHWDPTMCMVCNVAQDNGDLEDPEPGIGRTIMWEEENASIPGAGEAELPIIMDEYREEHRRGSILRARADFQAKIIYPEAGHLLTGVTA
ncbi:MAG TPA: hypothetical protein P5255_09580 [Phycisphaerae bacterium]|nr:hypothetical protein [Phycisphaerae bacterium]HRT43132.1 hypothetical protein [Phycisphaerae bacterium]